MMRRRWILAVCMMIAVTLAGCGGTKTQGADNAQGSSESEETAAGSGSEAEEVTCEEFARLGMTFQLPEGFSEEQGSDETTYYYRKDDFHVMLKLYVDTELNDDNVPQYAEGVAKIFDGENGEFRKLKIDGYQGYQFDVEGTINDAPMVVTYTLFNAPIGSAAFTMTDQTTDKADYEEYLDALISSIKIDKQAFEEAAQPDYYVKDNVAVTEDCTIKITKTTVLQPGESGNAYGSNPAIVIEYDMTNNSGKEITPAVEWPFIVTVIQDNDPNSVNELNTGSVIGAPGSDMLLQKIKVGGTVHCSHSYELTDTTTPVQLVFRNGVAGEELGTMTYNVQ